MCSRKMFLIIYIVVAVLFGTVKSTKNFQFDTFGHCLKRDDKPNFVVCAGQQMLETLQQFDNMENLTLAKGLTLSRDDTVMGRNNPINFLDQDPSDIRSLLENAGLAVSHRSLQWNMDRFYPGLQLRIGPSASGGLLEFIVDPSLVYDERSHLLQEESTARIMTRKFVLPFLLGLKFNLATLLPLILGAIILISKKAAFLSKLALFISGLFGLGGIATLGGIGDFGAHGGYGYQPGFGGGAIHHHQQYASPYKVLESNTHQPEVDHFYDFEKQHFLKDRSSRLYEREFDNDKQHSKYRGASSQRNFVWQTASNPNTE